MLLVIYCVMEAIVGYRGEIYVRLVSLCFVLLHRQAGVPAAVGNA